MKMLFLSAAVAFSGTAAMGSSFDGLRVSGVSKSSR